MQTTLGLRTKSRPMHQNVSSLKKPESAACAHTSDAALLSRSVKFAWKCCAMGKVNHRVVLRCAQGHFVAVMSDLGGLFRSRIRCNRFIEADNHPASVGDFLDVWSVSRRDSELVRAWEIRVSTHNGAPIVDEY